MTLADFARLGRLLHGAAWQRALGEDLGVSQATVRAWGAGRRGMPADVPAKLRALLVAKAAAMRAEAKNLRGR